MAKKRKVRGYTHKRATTEYCVYGARKDEGVCFRSKKEAKDWARQFKKKTHIRAKKTSKFSYTSAHSRSCPANIGSKKAPKSLRRKR